MFNYEELIDMDTVDEYKECLDTLDNWMKAIKATIYSKFINSDTNSINNEIVLVNYDKALESLGYKLLDAITDNDIEELEKLNWPSELYECIQVQSTAVVIRDRIEQWFIRNTSIMSPGHIAEINRENAGINSLDA